jgi:hypothetical protein
MFSGIRDHFEESFELLAGIIVTVCAAGKTFLLSTFPDFADLAMTDVTIAVRNATVTVDIRRLQLNVKLFRPELCDFRSFLIVITLCCNERTTITTD